MKEYTIEFYSKEDGSEPAREFIESLDTKMIAKLLKVMDVLEEFGPHVRLPYSEHLKEVSLKYEQSKERILQGFYIFLYLGKE